MNTFRPGRGLPGCFGGGGSRRFLVVVIGAMFPMVGCTTGTPPIGDADDGCNQSGVICTVAGTGLSLFDGDGKAPLATSLYFPLDVLFDETGQPLILDWNNGRIRRINEFGLVETIMGTDHEGHPVEGARATESPLHHASDIEFDAQQQLYVAGDHVPVVFRVDVDDLVHVVAGGEDFGNDGDGGPAVEAALSVPFGVLPDEVGGFYFSDSDAHVVRYVDADGIIQTVAGNGTRGYSGDSGPGSAAQLSSPSRMRLLPDGSLLICDTDNNVIRRLDTTGTITTFAGTGESGLAGDGGPAIAATLTRPYDLQIGPDGAIYVADTGNNVIRRIDATGTISTIAGTGVG
ncbi:MAG: hypothetical protein HOP29_09020, partial [Phycisphaerales bacterium]|nr:hypothetical protein [Phycisphaerales bacterium]